MSDALPRNWKFRLDVEGIGWLTLNRPEQLNALSMEMRDLLIEHRDLPFHDRGQGTARACQESPNVSQRHAETPQRPVRGTDGIEHPVARQQFQRMAHADMQRGMHDAGLAPARGMLEAQHEERVLGRHAGALPLR